MSDGTFGLNRFTTVPVCLTLARVFAENGSDNIIVWYDYSKRASLKKNIPIKTMVRILLVSNFVVELLSVCFNAIDQFTKKVAILCFQPGGGGYSL